MLARQIRLRLVAVDDSDIPRNLHNIVVSIHAIATFQALHDYLRPRVAGLLNNGSRLHGMLAALASSGLVGSSPRASNSDAAPPPPQPTAPAAESSTPATASSSSGQTTLGRRRSQRLSAKNAATDPTPVEASSPVQDTAETNAQPELSAPLPEGAPSETVVDSELAAEFSDEEEIDADVFDDVDPDRSVSEKTVMLSVGEGN